MLLGYRFLTSRTSKRVRTVIVYGIIFNDVNSRKTVDFRFKFLNFLFKFCNFITILFNLQFKSRHTKFNSGYAIIKFGFRVRNSICNLRVYFAVIFTDGSFNRRLIS